MVMNQKVIWKWGFFVKTTVLRDPKFYYYISMSSGKKENRNNPKVLKSMTE